ncbi:Clp protease N-terminal domain-containing protein [Streptomyces sp. NPDC050287]|uniref:Clp protease N-terminal domain-containing protein n=1 Tax=Streptomyces sp. NPDC050287 TaxID=3365608 RepID=UPI00378F8ECC
MQPRIPRQSAHERDGRRPAHTDDDVRLSDELAAVVSGARRRALRDGDRQIDTAHLLHSLLESDAEVRALFDGEAQLARLMGYLVQRSIGYGLRWQGSVEDSGAVPVVTRGEGLSPLAAGAMEYAHARAADRGGRALGVDLLAAIVADPQARAVEVLGRAGIDAREVLTRVDSRLWRVAPASGDSRPRRTF